MAKVLLINGSPNEHGCTYTALHEVEGVLRRHGIETEILWLGRKPVSGCIACNTCARTGHCVFGPETFDDKVNRVLDYAGGRRMAGKLGAAVVSCRRGGAASAFDQLNKYFTICNMPVVSSQYWNQVHGNTPEEVLQDAEGLQMMRTLGENMAWLLRSIEAGKKTGVPAPQYEPKVATNFIR